MPIPRSTRPEKVPKSIQRLRAQLRPGLSQDEMRSIHALKEKAEDFHARAKRLAAEFREAKSLEAISMVNKKRQALMEEFKGLEKSGIKLYPRFKGSTCYSRNESLRTSIFPSDILEGTNVAEETEVALHKGIREMRYINEFWNPTIKDIIANSKKSQK